MRCNDAFLIDNSDVNFTFDLTTRSSSLNRQYYSDYQHILYNIISEKLDKGMNYKEIADWLNDNGYKTTRGKRFFNSSTHSIMKKKKISDDRYNRKYSSKMNNCSIEITDKRLVNDII